MKPALIAGSVTLAFTSGLSAFADCPQSVRAAHERSWGRVEVAARAYSSGMTAPYRFPSPPAWDLACKGEPGYEGRDADQDRNAEEYVSRVLMDERSWIGEFLGDLRKAEFCGFILGDEAARQIGIARGWLQAMLRDALHFHLAEPSTSPERQSAVLRAGYTVLKEVEVLGGGTDQQMHQLGELAGRALEGWERRLRLEHDFRLTRAALLEQVRSVSIASGWSDDQVLAWLARIDAAWNFNFTLSSRAEAQSPSNTTTLEAALSLDGILPGGDSVTLSVPYLQGTMGPRIQARMLLPAAYLTGFRAQFSACAPEPVAHLDFGRFGAEAEVFELRLPNGQTLTRSFPGMLHSWTLLAQQARLLEGPLGFRLVLPLVNLHPAPVNQRLRGSARGGDGEISSVLELGLTHTPRVPVAPRP